MAVDLAVSLDAARLAARLVVSGIPAGADTLTIERAAPSGNTAGVRGATGRDVEGMTSLIVRDYEIPFNLDVVYTVTVWDGATVVGTDTVGFRVDWNECEDWFVDLARPTNSLPLLVESMRELTFETPVGVHRVLERRAPVLTALPAWTPTAELVALTDTMHERDAMRALLGSGYPFLLRTIPEQGIGNMYLGVTGFVEERLLTLGAAPQRRFRINVVQVERPDPSVYVPVAPNTYDQVKAAFATYAALLAAVGTYDQLAYTYGPDEESPLIPWLPDDV